MSPLVYSPSSILAERTYRAVDDALRDAEGLEQVLEEAVIPVE